MPKTSLNMLKTIEKCQNLLARKLLGGTIDQTVVVTKWTAKIASNGKHRACNFVWVI